MPVASTDLIFYGSANMQESDSGTQGGAIDATTKVIFTDIAATDSVAISSSAAGDTTQTVTIYGRSAGGSIVSEALSLNGTTRVTGSTSFERIMKIVVNASHTGTITVTRNNSPTFTAIATLESGILTVRRLFYSAQADASGGSSRDFYEKIFLKNTHGTLSLLSAAIVESADPGANITFDLESAVSGTNTATDRRTAPASGMLGTFTGSSKNVPGTDLAAGGYIGIWLKQTLAAGATPAKNTYTLTTSGSSV